jgi:enoyl-[acyl-carrier protein] reductase/trans-2-enoyl-CoA reductase (NAD+)
MIREDLGSVDLIVYSLASPRRTMADGTVYNSVLKTTSGDYENKTIDLRTNAIVPVSITPATPEEVEATIKGMGGEDWQDWLKALDAAGLLSPQTVTVAYSYIGPELTHPIYLNGSIGQAKRHLYETAQAMTRTMPNVKAYVSVNKALVPQASAAIRSSPVHLDPVQSHEGKRPPRGCIEQMYRLFKDKLYGAAVAGATDAGAGFNPVVDDAGTCGSMTGKCARMSSKRSTASGRS